MDQALLTGQTLTIWEFWTFTQAISVLQHAKHSIWWGEAYSKGWASPDEHRAVAALFDVLQVGLQDVVVHHSAQCHACTDSPDLA